MDHKTAVVTNLMMDHMTAVVTNMTVRLIGVAGVDRLTDFESADVVVICAYQMNFVSVANSHHYRRFSHDLSF